MLIHGESSHSRWWLQSLGPLTLPTKRRGIPRTQSLHGRDGHHLGFPVMSSPKSAMSVPPPVKKRRMWSLGEKMVLNCAQASSSPPQHTVFCGLRTAIPQVEVQETQPPQRECGLMVTSTRRLCPRWHLARRMNILRMRNGSSSVEKPLCVPDRGSAEERVSQKSSDNGYIPDGLGVCFQGRSVNGCWMSQLPKLHISLLEFSFWP